MKKIFVSTYPYGKIDDTPLRILQSTTGIQIAFNPYNRKLSKKEIASLAIDADVLIAGTEDLSQLIQESASLRMISRVGIGLDSVDLWSCREKGIRVSYTPDAVTMAVAEFTIGLILSLTRKIARADREIRKGDWFRHQGKRLEDTNIGLIGFGRVGRSVARLLAPFRTKLLVNDLSLEKDAMEEFSRQGQDIKFVEKDVIFQSSDIISLHVPYYSKTKHLINNETLSLMKNSTYLINTARGELIEEEALYKAIHDKTIAGAALDVFTEEPYLGKLTGLEDVLLTQHMGSCSFDCRLAMETQAAEEAIRFLEGKPLVREVPEHEYQYQK
ncbi:putative glyoxylate reductase [Leptospira ryugenii]|uniref:Putative glyoxylate reductase n=2 Tax=Leptospira ryugenii TaxID=1917863 RepID=A0A2P2DW46_9LEPT|nr:putative glyoxylate reductase [Leptospira ryugenii]